MRNSLISVIIPTYNRADSIGRAINSVLNQTYKNLECIVVDDGSTDRTYEAVQKISDARVIYVRLSSNKGACYARNVGILKAKGDYIAFQDSDDIWYEDKLKKELDYLLAKQADMVFCRMYSINDNKFINKKFPGDFFSQHEVNVKRALVCNFASTQTILAKAVVFRKITFDEELPRYQDWDLVIRILKIYNVVYLKEILVERRLSIDSIGNDPRKGIYGIKHIMKKYESEYKRYPRLNYLNYYLLGSFHMKLGEKSAKLFSKSLCLNPLYYKCWIKWLLANFIIKDKAG